MEFQEAPADLTAVASSFGAAHLFIDGWVDCPDRNIHCATVNGRDVVEQGAIDGWHFGNYCSHYFRTPYRYPDGSTDTFRRPYCVPCETPRNLLNGEDLTAVWLYWGDQCNQQYAGCNGNCQPNGFCHSDPMHPDYLCGDAIRA
jgi:hypothetical protein